MKLFDRIPRLSKAVCGALAFTGSALAAVVVNDNGEWPATPVVQTFDRTDAFVEAERDARFTRNLAQTFQLSAPVKLDKIFIDYEEGLAGKQLTLRLFTVANVGAGTLVQPGDAAFTGTVLFSFDHTTTDSIFT